MSRASLAFVSCAALSLLAANVTAQDHVERATLFNGSSLEGWQPEGGAKWEVRGGEIVGAAGEGSLGRLVLDRGYQDFVLTLAFRCDGCEAGVLLRRAPLASGNTSAILAAIAGPDAGTAYRVTMSPDGKELDRTSLHEFVGRERLPYMSMTITPRDDGWSDLRIQLRGDAEPEEEEGDEEGPAEPRPASQERVGIFGPLALVVARGEARYRDVAVEDLTRPAAGLIAEVTADDFEKVQLTDRFYAEGIAAGDVNRDGAIDVVTGPFAYLGPKYQRAQEIYAPMTYSIAGEGQHGQYT
ncbi:MAG: family 16 glycoside hydrolase, partial [Vicinamibacteraceae bacterium]